LDNLWEAFYKSFNSIQNYQVNISLLEEISDKETIMWVPFLKKKFFNAIENCNNFLTPRPDKLLQIQALRVGQVKEPCIGLTQENSIENSVQDSLPYIPWTHGPC